MDSPVQVTDFQLTTIVVREWLCWASGRMAAMIVVGTWPSGFRSYWPDYSTDQFQVLEFRRNERLKPVRPSGSEIELIDEILTLPNICKTDQVRRVIRLRSMIHPIRCTTTYSWEKIGSRIGIKPSVARIFYKRGLEEIVAGVEPHIVCRIASVLEPKAA